MNRNKTMKEVHKQNYGKANIIDQFLNDHKKLGKFVEDLNEQLWKESNGEIFHETPVVYTTSGLVSSIEFINNTIYFSEESSDWRDMMNEVYELKTAVDRLFTELGHFFRSRTNKKLEELYALGIEIEEVSDGTGQTNEKIHKEEGTETGE